MSTKFYYCPICGNVIVKLDDSGVMPVCCGNPMRELQPKDKEQEKTVSEKHVPVVKRTDDCSISVEIGSNPHPMTPDHHICFVLLETSNGFDVIYLNPEEAAVVNFCNCKDNLLAVYAYCNIHGLWKTTEIPQKPEKKRFCCRK